MAVVPRKGEFAFGESGGVFESVVARSLLPVFPLKRSMPFPGVDSSRGSGGVGRGATEPNPGENGPAVVTPDLLPAEELEEEFPTAGNTFGSTPLNHAGPEPEVTGALVVDRGIGVVADIGDSGIAPRARGAASPASSGRGGSKPAREWPGGWASATATIAPIRPTAARKPRRPPTSENRAEMPRLVRVFVSTGPVLRAWGENRGVNPGLQN